MRAWLMKVLHIINNLNAGGAEKLLVDSLPLYEHYGVNVDLLILNPNETPFLTLLKKKFSGQIYLSKECRLYSPRQIFQIMQVLRQGYDIVHVHLFPAMYWAVLAKILSQSTAKLVFTEHNTRNRRLDNRFLKLIDKYIYKYYDRVLAVSSAIKDILIEKVNMSPDKIIVVRNGINLSAFVEENTQRIRFFTEEDIVLIQVARFSPQKDQATLIRALSLLPNKYKLVLVGDGETRESCQRLSERLGLSQRILFLGMRVDVPLLLSSSDIVVQSSIFEGFCLAAIEGGAVRKPVVATDIDVFREVMGESALFFPVGDENALANCILQLEDEKMYNLSADRCFAKSREFSINEMVENIISKVYQRL